VNLFEAENDENLKIYCAETTNHTEGFWLVLIKAVFEIEQLQYIFTPADGAPDFQEL